MAHIYDPEVRIKRCKYAHDEEIFGKKEDEKADRISELPVFIVHRILSFLKSPKQVTKTSVLSKKWYHSIWSSIPELYFQESRFCPFESESESASAFRDKIQASRNNFLNFIDTTLSRYQNNGFRITTLYLGLTVVDSRVASVVDKCIRFVAQNKIEVLDLQIYKSNFSTGIPYSLPLSFFSKSTLLTTLRLCKCRIESSCCMDQLAFGSLKVLTLWEVDFQDGKVMDHILSSCSLLERIAVYYCRGLKKLQLYGLHKLRSVVVEMASPELVLIDINALSLQHFTFNNCNRHDVPRIEMGACKNLMSLNLSRIVIPDWPFHDFVTQFPLLEALFLISCTMIQKVSISSSCLKEFGLYSCESLTEVGIEAPNLLSFQYSGDDRFPCISSINTFGNWEANLSFSGPAQNRMFLTLRHFLLKHEHFKLMKLRISFEQSEVDLNELTNISTSATFELEHLKLFGPQLSSNYAAVLDGILWCCRPRALSLTVTHELGNSQYKTDFIQYIYEKLSHKRHTRCNGNGTGCWNHYVKNVEIEIFAPVSGKRTPTTLSILLDILPTIGWYQEIHFTLKW